VKNQTKWLIIGKFQFFTIVFLQTFPNYFLLILHHKLSTIVVFSRLLCQRFVRYDCVEPPYSGPQVPNFANLSSVWYEEIMSSVLHHSNRRNTNFNSTHLVFYDFVLFLRKWDFSVLQAKSTKICSIFISFDHQTATNEQNKCHIRNQHKKLRQLTYVSPKVIFPSKHTCGEPQRFCETRSKRSVEVYKGRNLDPLPRTSLPQKW
jgi:hypothetical protein